MTPRPNWLTKDRFTHLQQVWAQAQACWPSAPLPVQWIPAETANTETGLWSDLRHREVQIHGPTFYRYLENQGLKAYGFVRLSQHIGYIHLQPGNARFAGSLQWQARHFLKANTLSEALRADQYLQYFLDLGIDKVLYRAGAPVASLCQKNPQGLPPWILRLYEILFRLPAHDLCQGQPLSETEAACAHLAAQLWLNRRWSPQTPTQHMQQQLQAFLAYALPFLQENPSTVTPYTGLVMTVDQPLGLALPIPQTNPTVPQAPHDTGNSPPKPGKQTRLQPSECITQLPHHPPSALLSQYYSERAWPHLFTLPQSAPPLTFTPESQQLWQLGEPIQQLHWQASLQQSPTVIPGFTTRQYPPVPEDPFKAGGFPQALSLLLDASQSMPNPQEVLSQAVLQGFVWMLSALQQQLDVKVVNWAESRKQTPYTQNRQQLSEALLQVPAGATHFPWDDYLHTPAQGIVVILSDLGLLQNLQALCRDEPHRRQRLNAHALTYCFLDLPFDAPLQQQSLAELQSHLPRWHFALLEDLA